VKVTDCYRLVRVNEKSSFGAMLAAVLLVGGSVVSWASTCQTPYYSNFTQASTCTPSGLGCKIVPAGITNGGCSNGGAAPCNTVPGGTPVNNYVCKNGDTLSGGCTENETTHVITCTGTITIAQGTCTNVPIQTINGNALPNVPPCTPPG
jgi:hypothetical protein